MLIKTFDSEAGRRLFHYKKFHLRPAAIFISGLLFLFTACRNKKETGKEQLLTLPSQQISLKNLNAFQPVDSNWTIGGDIKSNREIEEALKRTDGTGILVNTPSEEADDHLLTKTVHGDLELELDFLMPRGSNSGIYLMGRYEIQLFDSWGKEVPNFADAGGIYERWDASRPKGEEGYEGHPPRLNAARAPGLWQHIKILFKAPAFDNQGEKTENAVFEKVWLNGVLVQKNAEVAGPTRSAFFQDEQETGPLMIQGDHGPMAIRNIRYKKYDKKRINLTDLSYTYYYGDFTSFPGYDTLEASDTGKIDYLSSDPVEQEGRYLLRFSGQLQAPNEGTYFFKADNAGMLRLRISDEIVIDQQQFREMDEPESATVDLESGSHSFVLEYISHRREWLKGLTLFGEGPQLRMQQFHASTSSPDGDENTLPVVVEPHDRVRTVRSFVAHNEIKRTHVINVGSPNGLNYSYDVGQAALLYIWNGPFINTDQMWSGRGENQTAEPLGPRLNMEGKPPLAFLNNKNDAWPDSAGWDQLHVEGYTLTDKGWPVFQYTFDDIVVEDKLIGFLRDRRLERSVTFDNTSDNIEDLWFQLASGKTIIQKKDGEYLVDDRTYYLQVIDNGGNQPVIRDINDQQELLIPILRSEMETSIRYAIIW